MFKLKLSYVAPPPPPGVFDFQVGIDNWVERIKEETNGRVQITVYPGGSLLSGADSYKGCADGIAELAEWGVRRDRSGFLLNNVFELPGINWTTTEARIKVIGEMLDKFPELREEFSGTKVVVIGSLTENVLGVNKDIVMHTPADLKGIRIGCAEGQIPIIQALGGTGVAMLAPDVYMAAEKGVVDGTMTVWGGNKIFNYVEVLKSYTEGIGLPRSFHCILINQETWDSLPPDIQKVFDDLMEFGSIEMSRGFAASSEVGRQQVVDAGLTLYTATPEEYQLWMDAVKTVQEDWVQEVEAKGLPGREVLTELLRLVEEYNK